MRYVVLVLIVIGAALVVIGQQPSGQISLNARTAADLAAIVVHDGYACPQIIDAFAQPQDHGADVLLVRCSSGRFRVTLRPDILGVKVEPI